MERFARTPEPLKDATAKSWIIWKEEFLIFMNLVGYNSRPLDFQTNMFKNLIGSVGIELINQLSFDNSEDKDNLNIIIKKISNYFNPEDTEIIKRYKFFSRTKKENETMECYIKALEEAAQKCNFGLLTNSLIRDVIIFHTHNVKLRQKYLAREHLTDKQILEIYKDHCMQEKMLQNDKRKQVKTSREKEIGVDNNVLKPCWRCESKHPIKHCPAWNHKCTICSNMHHFERCCKNKNISDPKMNNFNKGKEIMGQEKSYYHNKGVNL